MIKYFHGLNLGAGVQSTTLELMFRKRMISYDGQAITLTAAGFADTQREPAYVYRHLSWLMQTGIAAPHPILIVTKSDIGADLLRGENSTKQRFASIPAFTAKIEGQKTGIVRRQCTSEYKIKILDALWRRLIGMRPRQRVPKTKKLFVYYGISLDEKSRASSIWESYHLGRPRLNKDKTPMYSKKTGEPLVRRSPFEPRFPLIDMGMTRTDCQEFLRGQNIPYEVKRSACVFCPFHGDLEWLELQREDPEGWQYAVQLDRALREPGRIVNRNLDQKLYLHSSCVPLDLVQFGSDTETGQAYASRAMGPGMRRHVRCVAPAGGFSMIETMKDRAKVTTKVSRLAGPGVARNATEVSGAAQSRALREGRLEMKPTHPIELLACAIATQKGWFSPGTLPQNRKNPGDLRFAGQIGATRPNGTTSPGTPGAVVFEPIAQFSSNALGIAALFRQLWLQVAEGQTVRQIINQWAPASENNTTVYLQDVLNWTGLPADVPVLQLLPPLVQLNLPQT